MVSAAGKSDALSILSRAIQPESGDWSADVAKGIMSISISAEDRAKMHILARRASSGELTPDEEVEIETYRQVARVIELLKAKARLSLIRIQPRN